MLLQEVKFVDLDNQQAPFVISNSPEVCFNDDLDPIYQAELDAPPIVVTKADSGFLQNLDTGYIRETVINPEVMKAFTGEATDWKLVRVVFLGGVAQLVLANPKRLVVGSDPCVEGHDEEVEQGQVYLHLSTETFVKWSFHTLFEGKIDNRYIACMSDTYLRFTVENDYGVFQYDLKLKPNQLGLYQMDVMSNIF